jgi:hypothetical protein
MILLKLDFGDGSVVALSRWLNIAETVMAPEGGPTVFFAGSLDPLPALFSFVEHEMEIRSTRHSNNKASLFHQWITRRVQVSMQVSSLLDRGRFLFFITGIALLD